MYIQRTVSSHNPCGIDINYGYYALAECIICGTWAGVALNKWCDLKADGGKERQFKGKVILNVNKLKQIFNERFLTYTFLSEITGKSRTFFIHMFSGNHRYYPAELVYSLEEGLGLEEGELVK